MTDDDVIETEALFTRPVRTLFGKAFRHAWFRHVPRITYAVLVGRNVTTNTQTLDSIIDRNIRLRSSAGLGSIAAIDDATVWSGIEVGEWGWLFQTGAGNAPVVLPSLAGALVEGVFEVHQILQTLRAVGVATRTMTINVLTGMTDGSGATAQDTYAGPTGITDTQFGTFFIPRAPGLAKLNDNGTITTSDVSSLPLMLKEDQGSITSVIGAGLAADTHELGCLIRRVA